MGAYKPIAGRLAAKTDKSGDCWIWTGAARGTGYGVIGRPRGGVDGVHRVAYEVAYGDIPDGMHIDHLCRNRLCVRPDHLEAVTQAENNRRANAHRWAQRTHCKRGHEVTPENTFRTTRNANECRACKNLRGKAKRRGMTLDTFARLIEGGPDEARFE